MDQEEFWFPNLVATALLAALVETVLAVTQALKFSNGDPIKSPLLATASIAFLTLVMHVSTMKEWNRYKKGITLPESVYSATLRLIAFLGALTWFIISIIIFVFVTRPVFMRATSAKPVFQENPLVSWVVGLVAFLISGATWIEFG
ncbi:hypothetical protein FRC18_011916, partial [Serendipita sp. 400]